MENEQLRTAITRAGLSLEEFADIVGVDVKTVRRWLTGPTPYPQNRASVANALDTTEHALWPDEVPAPATTGAGEPAGHTTGDALVGYAHATDLAAPDVDELLRAAAERIQIVVPYLGSDSGLVELFRAGAPNGCRVRLVVEEPDERVEPLLGVDAIEVRASPAGEDDILFRVDDEMLLVFKRVGPAGTSPPVIHLHRQVDDGLFDRLAKDFDARWLEATPLTSRDQLHAWPTQSMSRCPNPTSFLNRTRRHPGRHHSHRRLLPPRPQMRRAAGQDDAPDPAPARAAITTRGARSRSRRDCRACRRPVKVGATKARGGADRWRPLS